MACVTASVDVLAIPLSARSKVASARASLAFARYAAMNVATSESTRTQGPIRDRTREEPGVCVMLPSLAPSRPHFLATASPPGNFGSVQLPQTHG